MTQKHIPFLRATQSKDGICIQVPTSTAHRQLTKLMDFLRFPYHTYALEEEKLYRVAIRGIPKELSEQEVHDDLVGQGIAVTNVHRHKNKRIFDMRSRGARPARPYTAAQANKSAGAQKQPSDATENCNFPPPRPAWGPKTGPTPPAPVPPKPLAPPKTAPVKQAPPPPSPPTPPPKRPRRSCRRAFSCLLFHDDSVIIAGDLNAKHQSWNCVANNTKGNLLFSWQDDMTFDLVAPTEPTHFPRKAGHSPDVLDIALLQNIRLRPTSIEVIQELTNSDHRPVLLQLDPRNDLPGPSGLCGPTKTVIDWVKLGEALKVPSSIHLDQIPTSLTTETDIELALVPANFVSQKKFLSQQKLHIMLNNFFNTDIFVSHKGATHRARMRDVHVITRVEMTLYRMELYERPACVCVHVITRVVRYAVPHTIPDDTTSSLCA
ncbi:endonuclease-reverse transcriptase domain-containing protein [Phthorimaea operculella]|nr:endonuclease-reverse transcriptase domain-containing protein [Phthorimaea operculella]